MADCEGWEFDRNNSHAPGPTTTGLTYSQRPLTLRARLHKMQRQGRFSWFREKLEWDDRIGVTKTDQDYEGVVKCKNVQQWKSLKIYAITQFIILCQSEHLCCELCVLFAWMKIVVCHNVIECVRNLERAVQIFTRERELCSIFPKHGYPPPTIIS